MMAGGGGAPSPYHHPRPYYPPPGHPNRAGGGGVGTTPERWDQYPVQQQQQDNSRRQQASGIPEPVRSANNDPASSYQHRPLSRTRSHVVPSEDGEPAIASAEHQGGFHGRGVPPPPAVYGLGGAPPPPPGYHDSGYGPPPPPPSSRAGGGYYLGQPVESYNTISGDDGSPPRTSSSYADGGGGCQPPEEYSPALDTPPRGGGGGYFDPYQDHPSQLPPTIHHGAHYPPPPHPAGGGGYHSSESPPRPSSYPPNHPPAPYGGGGPIPPVHDPYEPYDYDASIASPLYPAEAHYQVPAAVSNEVEPHRGGGLGPPLSPTPTSSSGNKYHQFRKGGRSVHSEPIILRKKFSWRNYPELEEYLISNRPDYLRHSALNYTAEQKHFNNRLTEGLLEVAARMNYVFDETCFNFVAVRDRIRCYYKSYVQSSKKRGVVVGFPQSPGDDDEDQDGDDVMVGEA
jgi:hypothetical protein